MSSKPALMLYSQSKASVFCLSQFFCRQEIFYIMKITVDTRLLYGIIGAALLLLVFFGSVFSSTFFKGTDTGSENSNGLVKKAHAEAGSEEKFEYLSSTNSSYCGLQSSTVDNYSGEDRIQGACCSAMDLHRYQEQVEGLKKYSNIDVIPEDPYDIPASLAKRLFEYQKKITLSSEEQATYDQAMEIAGEGGPCCCKCWRWYAFEGQAKYLITEYGWGAQEIADLWDIEDGCGGAGHSHEGGGHG